MSAAGQAPGPGTPADGPPGPEDVADAVRHGRAPSTLPGAQAAGVAERPRPGDPPPGVTTSPGEDGYAPVATPGLPEAPLVDDQPVRGGGVTVRTRGAALLGARDAALRTLRADGVAAALAARDPTLWGPEAAPEATARLGWLDLPRTSRDLLPRLVALRDAVRADGLDRVLLVGAGGAALAAEVAARAAGAPLEVLDTADPGRVAAALRDLERTVVVVSGSGGAVATDTHRRLVQAALAEGGLAGGQAGRHLVAVTDPGSPLEALARSEGFREVVLAAPDVDGCWGALSASALVPAVLAGVDGEGLLDEAAALLPALADPDGPGLALGAALGAAGVAGHDKVVLVPGPECPPGLADWTERLLAESLGGQARGLLPVVVEGPDAPGTEPQSDTHVLVLGGEAPQRGTGVRGGLGALLLLLEHATAVAARLLRVDPFARPDAVAAEEAAAVLAAGAGDDPPALLVDGPVEVHDPGGLLTGAATLEEALAGLLAAVPSRGGLAVLAFLDPHADADAVGLRALLAGRLAHPVAFGWGPRARHPGGRGREGGPTGVSLVLTGTPATDLAVPGRDWTLAGLHAAQAAGEVRALLDRGRPLLRLHLTDRQAGLARLRTAVAG